MALRCSTHAIPSVSRHTTTTMAGSDQVGAAGDPQSTEHLQGRRCDCGEQKPFVSKPLLLFSLVLPRGGWKAEAT